MAESTMDTVLEKDASDPSTLIDTEKEAFATWDEQCDEELNGEVDTLYKPEKEKNVILRAYVTCMMWLAWLCSFLDRFGVEKRGIELVEDIHKTHTNIADTFFLWASANINTATFSLGLLGPSVFGLKTTESCLTILFVDLVFCIPAAYLSTWGKETGLRQLTLSRYSFGYFGTAFPCILNLIACVGWSTVNTIVAANVLHSVRQTHSLPLVWGIIILLIGSLIVAVLGYKFVHYYEKYSSIPIIVIFFIMMGEGCRFYTGTGYADSGATEAGNVLSFAGSLVGYAMGWASMAADYTVHFPRKTPNWKVFWYTYAGMVLSQVLLECLGVVSYSTIYAKATWKARYENEDVGGLIGGLLSPMNGFGQFLMVVLGLATVGNNVPNVYSFGVTFQALGRYAQMVPRLVLSTICVIISIILGVVGRNDLKNWLDSLLVVLAYWLMIYFTIVTEEHVIFRKNTFKNYAIADYNTPSKLPWGVAALVSVGFGVMGAVLGMSQVWYAGVIGRKIGKMGGDIGFELSGAFTAVVYPVLRYAEIRITGR